MVTAAARFQFKPEGGRRVWFNPGDVIPDHVVQAIGDDSPVLQGEEDGAGGSGAPPAQSNEAPLDVSRFDPNDTMEDILDWVTEPIDDTLVVARAEHALGAERAHKGRKSLIERLTGLVED